jgi:exonuclease SbcC
VANLENQIEKLTALAQASNELNAARDNATQRAHEAHESAIAAGFASVAEATAHAIDATALVELTERVSAHDAAVAEVNQVLARPELVDLDPTAPEDTAALQVTANETKARADQTRREEGQATQTSEQVSDAAAEVATAVAERESVSPAAQTAVRLANIASGLGPDNPKRISLTSFVLMEYFRDVVEAANDRLGEISAGRYQLEPHDEQKDGRKSAGLGLRIIDQQTTQQRETGTMSGGEKLYASLSLALGLADVVQQGAGATRLDTLFIDEGFGSLDTHTLDLVMNALTKLSSSGRAVGIISHVDEIKSRIAERITMVPQRDGTSVISLQC